jgi:hypothetical protein
MIALARPSASQKGLHCQRIALRRPCWIASRLVDPDPRPSIRDLDGSHILIPVRDPGHTRGSRSAAARCDHERPAAFERFSSARNAQRHVRLSGQIAVSLSYKAKLAVSPADPAPIWIGRQPRGENVDVRSATSGGHGQTHMSVSGTVGRGAQVIAERGFGSEVLSFTPGP